MSESHTPLQLAAKALATKIYRIDPDSSIRDIETMALDGLTSAFEEGRKAGQEAAEAEHKVVQAAMHEQAEQERTSMVSTVIGALMDKLKLNDISSPFESLNTLWERKEISIDLLESGEVVYRLTDKGTPES